MLLEFAGLFVRGRLVRVLERLDWRVFVYRNVIRVMSSNNDALLSPEEREWIRGFSRVAWESTLGSGSTSCDAVPVEVLDFLEEFNSNVSF